MNRVVITGIGAVSPLGNTFRETWGALRSGRSGVSLINKFDVSGIPWKVAGEVKGFDANSFLNKKEQQRLDPFIHFAVAASLMAAEDAGLTDRLETSGRGALKSRVHRSLQAYLSSGGIIIGSSRGGITTLEQSFLKTMSTVPGGRNPRQSPYLMPSTTISMASSYAAQKLGIQGYCLGISNACASGTNALGEAYRLIRSGYPGPVLAGGAEAPVCRTCIEGYGATGALSRGNDSSASRPFDRHRDGFVLAEGACILVLEDLEQAVKRGARIYGEIIGYANTTDAFHQTRPDPGGEARALGLALADAGIQPEDIGHINVHGTSTPLGDAVESAAIEKIFGKTAGGIPVSAVKSMTGHMLAASGALEAASAVMSIRDGVIPPTINISQKDERCSLNIIREEKKAEMEQVLSSSFGFGGVNAVLVLQKFPRNKGGQ